MRFTEHELTQALHGAAKTVLASRKDVRKKKVDVDVLWNTMDKFERYQLLDSLGGQLIPVLIALPDVDVEPGTRATFTQAQVSEAVESVVGEAGGKLRRKATVALQVALVTAALEKLPVRRDPDGLLRSDEDADDSHTGGDLSGTAGAGKADGTDDSDDELGGFVVPDSLEGLEGF